MDDNLKTVMAAKKPIIRNRIWRQILTETAMVLTLATVNIAGIAVSRCLHHDPVFLGQYVRQVGWFFVCVWVVLSCTVGKYWRDKIK